MALVKHADQSQFKEPLNSGEAVKQFYQRRGLEFKKVVADVRGGAAVPFLENLLGPTFFVSSAGPGEPRAAVVRTDTGEEIAAIEGDGMISLSTYWSNFEEARRHLHRAIDQISFGDLEVAVERGVASIEAFIRARAEEWNRNNPNDQLTDDAKNKVPFNVKIDEWIPKMNGGQKLETGAINFQDFTRLKSMRDDEIVHSNSVSRSQKSSSSRNHKTGTVLKSWRSRQKSHRFEGTKP